MQLIFKMQEAGEAEVLFYPLLADQSAAKKLITSLNYEDQSAIGRRLEKENFSGKKGEIFVIHDNEQTVVFVGTGQSKSFAPENWRLAAGEIALYSKKYQTTKIGLDLQYWLKGSKDVSLLAQSMAEGLKLGAYEFSKYKKKLPDKRNLAIKEFYIYSNPAQKKSWLKGWDFGCQLVQGIKLTRDLVNEPAGTMTPDFLAKEAVGLAKKSKNIKVKILEKEEIAKLGMNAFLAISRGSHEAPKFIHLVYKPQKGAKKKVALVGKGITFDSGGLNIKPWENMGQMKIDMGGAGPVYAEKPVNSYTPAGGSGFGVRTMARWLMGL
ncbi:MAG: M17 family peptidase N-terminal domain-containing protein [Patescibacteria group bacterium]|nr:M17 family peptidase N-terminal domain-containing protein [Patescibacteria group bacterium]